MGKLILVLGGARSGKSRFAQSYATELCGQAGDRVLFIATATAEDDEMRARIEKHQHDRPAGWTTLETSRNIGEAIEEHATGHAVILLDCLTLLISSYLIEQEDSVDPAALQVQIQDEIKGLTEAASRTDAHVIIVSNEVGMGLVPVYWMGREFRDLTGMAHQLLASAAEEVYFLVAGIPTKIKPTGEKSPV
jgi:adenosylcobinamide kinase/adenosylcobinamide-phosphate guanylyltransferase